MGKINKAAENVDLEMYGMGLHETTRVGGLEIVRVPGGWMYSWALGDVKKNMSIAVTSCFVPFNTEFDPHTEKAPL